MGEKWNDKARTPLTLNSYSSWLPAAPKVTRSAAVKAARADHTPLLPMVAEYPLCHKISISAPASMARHVIRRCLTLFQEHEPCAAENCEANTHTKSVRAHAKEARAMITHANCLRKLCGEEYAHQQQREKTGSSLLFSSKFQRKQGEASDACCQTAPSRSVTSHTTIAIVIVSLPRPSGIGIKSPWYHDRKRLAQHCAVR